MPFLWVLSTYLLQPLAMLPLPPTLAKAMSDVDGSWRHHLGCGAEIQPGAPSALQHPSLWVHPWPRVLKHPSCKWASSPLDASLEGCNAGSVCQAAGEGSQSGRQLERTGRSITTAALLLNEAEGTKSSAAKMLDLSDWEQGAMTHAHTGTQRNLTVHEMLSGRLVPFWRALVPGLTRQQRSRCHFFLSKK